MAYIPPDAKWYIADVVMQIRVDGDPRTLVHINTLLVRADSPDEAYEKALDLGRGQDSIYENPEGREVSITFRGLQDLNVIHDPLEHGAELCYAERLDLSDSEMAELVTPRDQLGVFRPRERSKGLDYMPKDIADQLRSAGFDEV